MPPEATKPRPSVPAAMAGHFARSLPLMSVALENSLRSVFTASTRSSRSVPSSRRMSLSGFAILHRLQRQLRFLDRVLGHRRGAFANRADAENDEQADEHEERAGHDQQREPCRHRRRDRGRDRRQCEGEREGKKDRGAEEQADADADRRDLLLELGGGELQLSL